MELGPIEFVPDDGPAVLWRTIEYQRKHAWYHDDDLEGVAMSADGTLHVPRYDNFDRIIGSQSGGRIPAAQRYGWNCEFSCFNRSYRDNPASWCSIHDALHNKGSIACVAYDEPF